MERSKEYDAFGPWLYEIDEEHEIPRLFRDCCDKDDGYLLLFKVPRHIERRKASPNMDLYDYLIGASETCLKIFRRAGKKVVEQSVDYSDVFAVKDTHALLKGELVLYTYGEPVSVEYNTVSEDIILKLIKIIGSRISGAARIVGMEGIPDEYDKGREDSVDMLFENLLGKLKSSNPGTCLVAYEPGSEINWTRDIRSKLALNACVPAKLAFVTDDRELIVISQELNKKNRSKETVDHAYLYVPYQNIKRVNAIPFDGEHEISIMELNAGSKTLRFVFKTGNSSVTELCRRLSEMAMA
jgi:hypothetical protein